VVLTDPAAVRALAHPARLAVIDALYTGDELTATECAHLAGISPSAMSYHLRALEKYGIAVRAEGRSDGRQRPWRRAGSALQVDLSAHPRGQSAAAATELLIERTMTEDRRRVLQSLASEPNDDLGKQWMRATAYERMHVVVTPDEARQLRSSIEELVTPYEADARVDPPTGAERVVVSLLVVKDSSTEGSITV
jgi:DNA-binding transcriptional ArsR family regulator